MVIVINTIINDLFIVIITTLLDNITTTTIITHLEPGGNMFELSCNSILSFCAPSGPIAGYPPVLGLGCSGALR
eukprot:4421075-Pyramimonas_sp.AAC.1